MSHGGAEHKRVSEDKVQLAEVTICKREKAVLCHAQDEEYDSKVRIDVIESLVSI